MKKYFIATVVAVLAFAFAAFAASFTVGDQVLASGSGDVVNCGDEPEYLWDTHAVTSGGEHYYWVDKLTISGLSDCDDQGVHATVSLSNESSANWMKISDEEVSNGEVVVDFPDGHLDVEDIQRVAILLKKDANPGWTNIP